MNKKIEHPKVGDVYSGPGGLRRVVSVTKRSNRGNDYNVEWQRPDNDWRSTSLWLPYWAKWARNATLVQYGCHCDLDPGDAPDECVIDLGQLEDCIHAKPLLSAGKTKWACKHWLPIDFK